MLGERLHLARKKEGLSLRDLSAKIEGAASAQAIGKYERDEMTPSSRVLIMLSKALNVSVVYLMAPMSIQLTNVEFRQAASKVSAKDNAIVKASVIEHVERYLMIEEIIGIKGAGKNIQLSAKQLAGSIDAEKLAKHIRDKWNLGQDPIPDMTELLEEKGFKVMMLKLPDNVSGLTCFVTDGSIGAVPAIVVNHKHGVERRRMTLAHELGHHVIPDDIPDAEKMAMRFAGALLAPAEHLYREIGKHRNATSYREIIDLKKVYRMSATGLLMRLHQIDVIDRNALKRAFSTFAGKWRKTEPEPISDTSSEIPRRMERLCLRALSEDMISITKAAELMRRSVAQLEAYLSGPVANEYNSD